MTTRTITHLYDSYEEAVRAVDALENAGVPQIDISLVATNPTHGASAVEPPTETASAEHSTAAGAGAGATLGTVVGGGAGLLAGIGAMAIPGVGPVVAAGWLVATVTGAGAGAAAGGLLGSLTSAGVSETDAHAYAEGVRRGGTLLSVRTGEFNESDIEAILGETQVVDITRHDDEDRVDGWNAIDPETPGHVPQTDRLRSPLV